MKLPDDLKDKALILLIMAGNSMSKDNHTLPHLRIDWEHALSHYLANRPMTVQEAGALAKKNPTPAQAKASRTNGLLGGRKKGGTK